MKKWQHENIMPDSTVNNATRITRHLAIGSAGENAAARLLEKASMHVLERNWRHGHLELDIVCQDADTIVFVEVKTRSSENWGGPAAGLTGKKKENLIKAARYWLSDHNAWDRPCRFDVICIVRHGDNDTLSAEHIPNAFDSSRIVHSRHSSWQPW